MEVPYSCNCQARMERKGFSIGFLIGTLSISSLLPLLLWLDLKLPDFLCQRLNTPLILLRYLVDFLHGIVDLHGA